MNDNITEQLESIAEDLDVSLAAVKDAYQDNLNEVKNNSSGLSDEKIESIALRTTRAEQIKDNRMPTQEKEILVIGHGGIREWSNYDDNGNQVGTREVLIAYGLVEHNDRDHVSVIIIDEEDGIEIPLAFDAFKGMGNIVTGEFSVSESDLEGKLVLNSSGSTEISVQEPPNREAMVSEIREHIPEFTIENIADNLSATERSDNGDEYPVDFGVDLKMIEADVYDSYKRNGEFGIYTLRDETVFDDEDVANSPVYDEDSRTPGLTCWIDPDMMEFGTGSVGEFIGTVTQNDEGQIQMNAVNVNTLFETDFDGTVDSGTPDQDEDVETESDRMEI